MLRAIYPGSFDPVTFGHLDVIERSARLADELIVGVLQNNHKRPLFSTEERVKMLEETTEDLKNIKILPFDGLLVDFAKKVNARMIVRGLRAVTDFEYEIQMAQTNHKLEEDMETVFLSTSLKHSYLSSTVVKEVAAFRGDISRFVPAQIVERIQKKMIERGECKL